MLQTKIYFRIEYWDGWGWLTPLLVISYMSTRLPRNELPHSRGNVAYRWSRMKQDAVTFAVFDATCVYSNTVQVNNQLALHLACSRTGPGTVQLVQQILRWSSKECRLTADDVMRPTLVSFVLFYTLNCWHRAIFILP